jgi:hypothetical protein
MQETAVLIVRAWLEDGTETPLRARIIHTLDVTGHGEILTAVATQEEIHAAVQTWLDAFMADRLAASR